MEGWAPSGPDCAEGFARTSSDCFSEGMPVFIALNGDRPIRTRFVAADLIDEAYKTILLPVHDLNVQSVVI